MKPKIVLFGLVRDKDGKPVVDGDWRDLPEPIKAMLTDEDRDYLETLNGTYSDDRSA